MIDTELHGKCRSRVGNYLKPVISEARREGLSISPKKWSFSWLESASIDLYSQVPQAVCVDYNSFVLSAPRVLGHDACEQTGQPHPQFGHKKLPTEAQK